MYHSKFRKREKRMKLGSKEVNQNSSVYFIAEIGINHNGDVNLAKQMITVAKDVGADCVKFQKRNMEECYIPEMLEEKYESVNSYGDTYGEHKKALELSKDDFRMLKKHADNIGIDFIATPFDRTSANFLQKLDIPFFKISSGDLTNLPLLKHVSLFGKPMILSTGNSELKTIQEVMMFLEENEVDLSNVVLMSCTSAYPSRAEDIDLNVIRTLQKTFPQVTVGYSGHERGTVITLGAVACGATVGERHITFDRNMKGSDHICSLEKHELARLMVDMRELEKSLGSGEKYVKDCEKKTARKLTKSIVATRDIQKGDVITEDCLTVKHPGDGISPLYFYQMVGKIAPKDLSKNELLPYQFLFT
jgi:sialic acid synthase SpsE